MGIKMRLSVGCIGLISLYAHAFIYEVVVLQRWVPERGSYQRVIGLSDFHDKQHGSNKEQLATIKTLLRRQNPKVTKIIVEDLSTGRDNNGQGSCRQFSINSRGGILGGLARSCKARGLCVDNVEYRYCRVAASGPVLNNLHQNPHSLPSACGVTVRDVTDEIHRVMDDVKKYTSSEVFARYCAQALQEVHSQLKELRLTQQAHRSMADYLHRHSTADARLEFLKRLLTFDSGLIDLKILHSIMSAPQFTNVIVIAGGSHIARVRDMLMCSDYDLVYTTQVSSIREYDLQRCIGSTIVDGAFCVRPESIDLQMLGMFL